MWDSSACCHTYEECDGPVRCHTLEGRFCFSVCCLSLEGSKVDRHSTGGGVLLGKVMFERDDMQSKAE